MSDERQDAGSTDVQQAEVVERSRLSIVWLLPLLALVFGGWLLFKSIRDRGVPITVTFETADGLEAGKTAIRYRDVQVGVVEAIAVASTRDHVEVEIVIDRGAEDMLAGDTRFWVVRPRATLKGISGLGTLLSGAYIAIEPGKQAAEASARSFEGLEQPPVLERDAPGGRFVLRADSLGSISVGSPLYFRGILVGEVLKYELDDDLKGVTVEVFVKDPHHKLVVEDSRFWNASGIDVVAGADGLRIETASLEAMLIGGIEFDSPVVEGGAGPAASGTEFELHASRADVELDMPGAVELVCYFEDSLRGLSVGAPVEFRGITIGHVASIDVRRDPQGQVFLPVTIAIRPDRLALPDGGENVNANARLPAAIERGLRAKLSSGSLLTGALFVELVFDDSSPPRLGVGYGSSLPEVPTIASGLAALEASLSRSVTKLDSILTKIDELPLGDLVQNAADAAESINRLASSPDLERVIQSAGAVLDDIEPTLDELRKVLRGVDDGMQTVVDEMQATTESLRGTLSQAERTLAAVDDSVGPDSATQVELERALAEVARAARSMRELASYLERHPEALLQGKSENGGR